MKQKTKIVMAMVVLVLLGIFLPPNINGTRFRDRLRPALSAALGREVRIGQVKYRLLPRPGFDLYDFRVEDDRAYSAEPLLICGKVTADLRLTSLWQGRLEIAKLKLTDDSTPPSLNLVYVNGHWNLESLLLRVEQVPSAPTARRRAEQRARFPYIEASSGRINLKIGPEKKAYALTNTDFAFWLAAEDVWHLRLEGHPVRTDMNLNDTGTVKLEGDLRRSQGFSETPVKLDVSWHRTQLGQLSSLVLGHDPGWRGDLEGEAQLVGTPSQLHLTAQAQLSHFRHYDVNRDSMPDLRIRCLGDSAHGVLEMKCDTPLGSGGLLATGRWSAAMPEDYDLSIVATEVPLSLVATAARHARRSLPDDVTATGDLSAAFGVHSHNGEKDWHGTGMTSPFVLESPTVGRAFPISAVKFHMGAAATTASTPALRRARAAPSRPAASPRPGTFTVDTFAVQLDPSSALDVQGSLDGSGYWIAARGRGPVDSLLALGRAAGMQISPTTFTATGTVDVNVIGSWGAPPRLHGTARLENVAALIPGIKHRLLLAQANVQLTDAALVLSDISGQFEHTPVSFRGSVTRPWSCQNRPACPLEFDLHADLLAVGDIAGLLGGSDKGWSLPFVSDASIKLPDFRGQGTISVDQLTVAHLPLEKFTARVEALDHTVELTRVTARLGGGSVTGEWKADWTGAAPRFSTSGTLTGVTLDHLGAVTPGTDLLDSWLTGKADLKYSARFEGKTQQELMAGAVGQAEFTVTSGSSRRLLFDGYNQFRFSSLRGNVELEKQTLRVLPSKFRAENRIYEISGTVTLADQTASLKASSGGSRWEITGSLDKPKISAQPMEAQTTSAHPR
ncbi:MAG TPA: AsmA family protein [Terriglobales bacterium]